MTLRQPMARPTAEPTARVVPRRRGQRFYLSLAAALGIVGLLAGVAVVAVSSESEPVIAANRNVPAGEPLEVDDLVQVQIPTGIGLSTIPWSRVADVLGRPASSPIERGQLLSPGLVRDTAFPAPGMAIIEVSGREGQIPAGSLGPGDRVLVVDGADDAATSSIDGEIVRTGGTSDRRTAEVLVRVADASSVARTSMAGRAVIVLVEDR